MTQTPDPPDITPGLPPEVDNCLLNALVWADQIWPGQERLSFSILQGDASLRRYLRLFRDGRTIILMVGPDKLDNRRWLYLGRRLWYHGLPVPKIAKVDIARGRFLLDDLGQLRLDLVAGDQPEALSWFYHQLAVVLADWHDRALAAVGPDGISVEGRSNPPYDQKFAHDQEWLYFIEGLRLLGLNSKPLVDKLSLEAARLTSAIGSDPDRVLIHRDFQSRNVMIYGGQLRIIDWQGARLGPAAY
ncbi:MAG: phosphotransferase, partial [Deltaproteobacteria bacterium]|nr:phosphotransferase [Deltaproteobacteria bacterium]